jgi:maltooligosyltrehalose trehalohydrolase
MSRSHRMPFGAEVLPNGSVRFRLWAPKAQNVALRLEGGNPRSLPMGSLENGWFELITTDAAPGSLYKFQIDGKLSVPDPASRFQPQDVHGPSEVINPASFEWLDTNWRGRPWEETVIYELHVGTFSPEGTFRGVEQKLDYLQSLGVTAIELMPLSDFPGKRNWGYDGVLPYAPDSSYGRPDDLKHFVQVAHAKGLMVFVDVVYNHFGPDGNYLGVYASQFFTSRHCTPWGDAINFDGPDSRVVRDFFIHNALYWLEEYHIDGLRLDAVHSIIDESNPNILTELSRTVRDRFGEERFIHLVLENGDNASRYLRRDAAGAVELYDAQWNDDIHHAVHVLLTGESDGYYSDYSGDPMRHLCRCLSEGFAFQGDYSEYHGSNRGEPSVNLPPAAFVSFLQNHDQIGNRAFGDRITQLAASHQLKAAMEILLLAPQIPLLFMGEEFGASTPFLFFCDFQGDLAAAVTKGRRSEFSRFAKFNSPDTLESIPDPNSERTFQQSKLDWKSLNSKEHADWLRLYRDLLTIRHAQIVPHLGSVSQIFCQVSQPSPRDLALDWHMNDGALLELRANLGSESHSLPAHRGDVIYASDRVALDKHTLPPWTVAWFVKA